MNKKPSKPKLTNTHNNIKTVAIHKHHAKSYRKRHLGLLVFSLLSLVILFGLSIQYRDQLNASLNGGRDFIGSLFNTGKSYNLNVKSTFGFTLNYDQKQFYASAIDVKTGDLFLGDQLNDSRPYNIVRVAPSWVSDQSNRGMFTLTYHDNDSDMIALGNKNPTLESLQSLALKDNNIIESSVSKNSSKLIKIDKYDFLKTTWKSNQKDPILSKLNNQIVTYVGVVDGIYITISLEGGINDDNPEIIYKDVISSIKFGKREQAYISSDSKVASNMKLNRNMIDTLLFSNVASAASSENAYGFERVPTLYSPAVIKIYNSYCMDILFDNKIILTGEDACSGNTGSGFFISQNGHIATNGHVATSEPASILFKKAIDLSTKGDSTLLDSLISTAGLKDSDIPEGSSRQTAAGIIIDALYDKLSSRVTSSNEAINLLVCLNDRQPDVNELIKLTSQRSEYLDQNTIKRAEVIASDYRAIDGYDGWRASDVAIIKIEGSNYPTTTLGAIRDVNTGSNLTIMGYPGVASDNGLVDSSVSVLSLTSGKVSSVKKSLGSDNMLVETDATIGHGNSGGPAFSDNGDVVGLATYSGDNGVVADGTFNYIRDIKDLIDLAKKSSIEISSKSTTQDEWRKGMDNYYSSHLSSALVSFNKVKELYPAHPTVDKLIDSTNRRIKNGEDVKDFPVLIAVVVGIILIGGAGLAVFLIINHNKKHKLYKDNLSTGAIQPFTPGMAPQYVTAPISYQPPAAVASVPIVNNPMQQPVQQYQQPVVQQMPQDVIQNNNPSQFNQQ